MAIQPIDLTAIYNNMHAAQTVAGQQHAAKLAEASHQQQAIQNSMEEASRVKNISGDESTTGMIKNNGGGSGGAAMYGGMHHEKRNGEDKPENQQTKEDDGFRELYLGRRIDITG